MSVLFTYLLSRLHHGMVAWNTLFECICGQPYCLERYIIQFYSNFFRYMLKKFVTNHAQLFNVCLKCIHRFFMFCVLMFKIVYVCVKTNRMHETAVSELPDWNKLSPS